MNQAAKVEQSTHVSDQMRAMALRAAKQAEPPFMQRTRDAKKEKARVASIPGIKQAACKYLLVYLQT